MFDTTKEQGKEKCTECQNSLHSKHNGGGYIDWLCKSRVVAVAAVVNPDKEMVLSESQLALCTVFTLYLGEYLNALIG